MFMVIQLEKVSERTGDPSSIRENNMKINVSQYKELLLIHEYKSHELLIPDNLLLNPRFKI